MIVGDVLLRGHDTLSTRAKARLEHVFAADDLPPRHGVKEQLRRLLRAATVEQPRHEKMILNC